MTVHEPDGRSSTLPGLVVLESSRKRSPLAGGCADGEATAGAAPPPADGDWVAPSDRKGVSDSSERGASVGIRTASQVAFAMNHNPPRSVLVGNGGENRRLFGNKTARTLTTCDLDHTSRCTSLIPRRS